MSVYVCIRALVGLGGFRRIVYERGEGYHDDDDNGEYTKGRLCY